MPIYILPSLKATDVQPVPGSWLEDSRGVYQLCNDCSWSNWSSLDGLVLALPEGQAFLREHGRIRTLPQQEIETDGQAAIVTRFESVTGQARFEVVSASETYQVLRIDGRRP